jgi:hypothetical protein
MFEDEYSDEEYVDEKLNYYIEIGVVEVAGIDENGEFIYKINDSAEELAPELWQAHHQHVDDSLIKLFEEGMVEVSYDENLEASIRLTEEGEIFAKSMGLVELSIDDTDIPNN